MATAVAMRIDPRLRKRRIAVRRAEGRRRLRVLGAIVLVAGIGVACWFATQSRLLDLDHVEIAGVEPAQAALIEAAMDLDYGMPLVDFDQSAIELSLTDLAWVQSVTVTREWPGTITVGVVERVAVALMPRGDGSHVLVDAYGVAIAVTPGATPPAVMPIVAVRPEGSLGDTQHHAAPALAVVASMPDDLASWVEAIEIDESGLRPAVVLDLVGSATAELGPAEDLGDKLDAVRAVLSGVELECLATIDARVPDHPTVTRNPICEATLGAVDDPNS
ncbi:MAG: FtsQ-type POTRA domain-containing protein [Acidimicrobiaceae bacterium]|nr:FtsQ-type POTRA domain-containing protein [Acidimicrobiaceae bacterium]